MSTTHNDGGPAFPRTYEFVEDGERMDDTQNGMTLRDYFASLAIPKTASPLPRGLWQAVRWALGLKYEASCFDHKQNAENAYQQADAMLQARRDRGGEGVK